MLRQTGFKTNQHIISRGICGESQTGGELGGLVRGASSILDRLLDSIWEAADRRKTHPHCLHYTVGPEQLLHLKAWFMLLGRGRVEAVEAELNGELVTCTFNKPCI